MSHSPKLAATRPEVATGCLSRLGKNIRNESDRTPERRRSPRVPLHCVLRVFRAGESECCNTRTEDISNSGFSCLVPYRVEIGDQLQCEIEIPVRRFAVSASDLRLTCAATVVRVQELESGFGIGCEFDDFALEVR